MRRRPLPRRQFALSSAAMPPDPQETTDRPKPKKWRRRAKRLAAGAGAFLLLGAFTLLAFAWVPMGKRPVGDRLVRMQSSPQWGGRTFVNPEPMWNDYIGMFSEMASSSEFADPQEALEFDGPDDGCQYSCRL